MADGKEIAVQPALDAEAHERAERKARRRRQWRCFWTRPLGHHYLDGECAYCRKTEPVPPL